jgi:hypothetical protein
MHIKLNLELAQALINYLQAKPYIEVHQLIEALLKCEKSEEEVKEKPVTE